MNLKKYIINTVKGLGLFTVLAFSSGEANAQLNGTYTINSASATSGTNYQTWTAFATAFNAAAITGPVTVNVLTDELNTATAITLNANAGSSATNTLTIDGGSKKLQGNSALVNAVLRLNGVDYMTLKNLTIENTSTTPGGIWFTNQADYNTVSGVNISFNANSVSNTTTYYIAFSNSVTAPSATGTAATGTAGQPGRYNTISNCKMFTTSGNVGPYYGVTLNGNTSDYTTAAQNNTLSGCTITNFYYYGIYQAYTNGNQISTNDISRNDATTGGSTSLYGIYSNYAYSASRSTVISGNSIHDLPFKGATLTTTTMSLYYGVYAYYHYGNSTYRLKIADNIQTNIMQTSSSNYGMYIYYPTYSDITGNKIDNLQSSGTATNVYGFYIYYPSYSTITTNSVVNGIGNYYWYSYYIYYPSYCDVLQNSAVNNKNNYTTGYMYSFYIYYPTGLKCNGNLVDKTVSNYYMYSFYIYYGSVGTYTWNEFQENTITNNISVNYNYSSYIYYYNGTNNFKINRNYIVGNQATGSTGYHYVYWYYLNNYEVIGNVIAGNKSNSLYIYLYSGLSGSYTAEVRNNTFVANTSNAPTPGSSYIYCYLYLYYHTVYFTGNIIDLKNNGPNTNYYRYLYMYLSYSTPANLKEFNDNTYSLNNLFTYPYWYFNGTNYTDWAGFSGAGVNGSRDNGDDPKFVDQTNNDWRAGAWTLQNNVAYLPINIKDNKLVLRNKTKHDRGGLETNTDLEAVSTNFTVPAQVCAGYTTGSTYLIVKSNYAYDKARNFNVSYALNGGPKVSALVTKQLAQNDTVKVYFPKPLVLNNYGAARIAIFVDLPDDNNSNDSFIFNTFVKPAPGGGVMTYTAQPTQAYYQPSKSFDVTILGQPVNYAVNSPRIYANKDYKGNGGGDNWQVSVSARCKWGKAVTGASFVAPTSTSDLVATFKTTDKTLEDSIITLYVVVNDLGNGCDTVIKRDILLYPTIVPNFTKPTQVCIGENVLFENKSTVTSGNMEFDWDFGTGDPADKTDAPDPVFSYSKAGTYKVKMTAKTLPYGFPSYDSTLFTVNPVPVVDFGKKNACGGYQLEFTNKSTPANATLSWDFGDGSTPSTATNPNYKYNKIGAYTVTLTADLAGCIAKSTQRVYQFENPKSDFKVVSGACENIPFVFENKSTVSSGNIGSYWNFDDNSVSTAPAPKHLFNGSGDKNVKLIITSEFGCKDSITKIVTIDESPKTKFSHGPACSLTPTGFVNLTPKVAGTIAQYDWVFSDGGTSRLESPNKSWSTLGPKTATLTVSLNNGCTESYTQSLNVLVQPKAQFNAADVCAGEPVTFSNNSEWKEGVISFDWDFGDGNLSTESDPLHKFNVSLTTTYNVTLKASIEGGCVDSFTKQVIIHEGPKTCDFVATPDYAYGYYGMKFEPIDASGTPGAQSTVNYTWVIENGGKQAGNTVQHNFVKDGEFTVTMYATTKTTGCECIMTKKVVMNRAGAEDFSLTGATIFPNPSEGNYQIMVSENFGQQISIEMRSATGALVKVLNSDNTGLIPVNASELSNGMYFVRIQSGDKVVTKKLNISK